VAVLEFNSDFPHRTIDSDLQKQNMDGNLAGMGHIIGFIRWPYFVFFQRRIPSFTHSSLSGYTRK
jgi:hypothetical protein